MSLTQKNIVLIISGGIAAYKMNYLVRHLKKENCNVKVVLTPSAKDFVSTLTLSTLSESVVLSEFQAPDGSWNNHVELALWADLILVAPCTASTLSKMVHGQCDNFALAVYMSAKCPVFIAPAMDLDMYDHPSTKQNLELAQDFGHAILPAAFGELASGLVGQGRLMEPEQILSEIQAYFASVSKESSLSSKNILITAGPTYEAIDPVRFIGNHSSGKMGYALAEAAAARGAKVILISGPSQLNPIHPNIELHRVVSAKEMFDKVFEFYSQVDIAIASAAVADYAPKVQATEKIKKNEDSLTIELVKNPDILKTMGERKENQFLVGFALETQNELENARTKLQKKNLDLIVLNSLKDSGAGFRGDTNKIQIISSGEVQAFDLKSKPKVAQDILDQIERFLS